jgi:glutamate N-acetyltransferase / amino-acid N-acetyltransferase
VTAPRFPTRLPQLAPSPFTFGSFRGVRAAGVAAGIKASGRPDIALLAFDRPSSVAAVFTRNAFAAAPVIVSRSHVRATGGLARAIVVNSGNANACTGEDGLRDARSMCEQVASGLGCSAEEVLVASTGVIGHKLPIDRVRKGIERALSELAPGDAAGRRFLDAIQTTDAFAKEASAAEEIEGRTVRAAGFCKGAGMIHPDMATLLAFVGVELPLSPTQLAGAVGSIAAQSFNSVHVDTHPSTNDTLFLFAGGDGEAPASAAWAGPATRVARRLAWLIARDGEGATKVTTITVRGATSHDAARKIATLVASSALVRTALFGNDPNWGRFVSQVGNSPELRHPERVTCRLQGETVFREGEPVAFDRGALSSKMATEDVSLELDLSDGSGEATVMTSDLGYRYVEVNAEYTT